MTCGSSDAWSSASCGHSVCSHPKSTSRELHSAARSLPAASFSASACTVAAFASTSARSPSEASALISPSHTSSSSRKVSVSTRSASWKVARSSSIRTAACSATFSTRTGHPAVAYTAANTASGSAAEKVVSSSWRPTRSDWMLDCSAKSSASLDLRND